MTRARTLGCLAVAVILVTSCTAPIPYRTKGFDAASRDCSTLYNANAGADPIADRGNDCWLRSYEARDDYDLLVAEFDDQGWAQGTSSASLGTPDHLDQLFRQLEMLYQTHRQVGLSLIVFVHGWHHNAEANDENVRQFRELLRDLHRREQEMKHTRRLVGLYVGWRAESVRLPWLNMLTFWDRKSTGERVAQGSVRALLLGLNEFQYRKNYVETHLADMRPVRMVTIGHSFGGLVVFEALSTEFLRSVALLDGSPHKAFARRVGDLVIIANPAFEGTRYEPLNAASQKLAVERDQLPTVIVATSRADWATGLAFPAARFFSTLLETAPGPEYAANVKTVGHNERYTTHTLDVCASNDEGCARACPAGSETILAGRLAKSGLADDTQYFCERLKLTTTEGGRQDLAKGRAKGKAFLVVETTGAIMHGHNDIFNPNFVAFIRQVYEAVILARHE